MKTLVFLMSLLISLIAQAQWTTSFGINSGRNDDICFINDSVGYVAGGNRFRISKTIDGGSSWSNVFVNGAYLRSIKFIDESTGFCGSLDSAFFMTTDSGSTWIDISQSISPRPRGICGISIPDDSTIYGCGIYNEPAFIIKSTDRGLSWSHIDMSLYAKALVEVHFVSRDTGYASGRANPLSDGGVILSTTDGGLTWQSVFKTMRSLDYVWKIQSPDGKNFFGSVSSAPHSPNTTFLKSTDRGFNWTQGVVDTTWYDIQMIGFIDSLKGWTGGAAALFETIDGGQTWNRTISAITGGSYYNRFTKKNDSSAFISGARVYQYIANTLLTGFVHEEKKESIDIHSIQIIPNPTSSLRFNVELGNKTNAIIQLINMGGNILETFYNGELPAGEHTFYSKKRFKPQSMFLVMRTNEGLFSEKVIFK
ncbi:MAG: photosystem II stability/assembly factor-like uncharacterized protein [Vicingaceae bacterium]|jgi:photosystem II stability/assembly factor-like uncharacterized protein